ncbi:hypothetical protein DPMN_022574 [Dreissena polymorpha]|uniref:Uncharacterized protein n=1 Tax=Dreissena polymorpha TaxID=45954 RepID=A0A9D4NPK6_DREPO|nr:hypothetical protein DPMN_022574 [Dreissena polymorpha]
MLDLNHVSARKTSRYLGSKPLMGKLKYKAYIDERRRTEVAREREEKKREKRERERERKDIDRAIEKRLKEKGI